MAARGSQTGHWECTGVMAPFKRHGPSLRMATLGRLSSKRRKCPDGVPPSSFAHAQYQLSKSETIRWWSAATAIYHRRNQKLTYGQEPRHATSFGGRCMKDEQAPSEP